MQYKYLTTTPSIGGRIKKYYEDFIVEEIGEEYKTKLTYLPDKKVFLNWDPIFKEKAEDKDYLYVDMEKSNVSTTTAIKRMSRFLHMSKKRINYAGLKDKRAITVQKVSIYNPSKERVSKFHYKNIKIYNPTWRKEQIDIGDLKKNKFTIRIRDIKNKSKKELEKIFKNYKKQILKKGFLNYFAEQRFGGLRNITHNVGKLLIKRKYKEAIVLYLTKSFDLEREDLKKARKELKEDLNFRKHAANFPARAGYESAILNYLANNPDDYLGALMTLPRGIQYLFVHAYQSYLFNKIINIRKERNLLDKQKEDRIENSKIYIPLFGYESKLSKGKIGEIEREVLNQENMSLWEFKNPDYSVLSSKGSKRKMFSSLEDLKLVCIDDNTKDTKKLIYKFTLEKGQYATNVVRELIKPTKKAWY